MDNFCTFRSILLDSDSEATILWQKKERTFIDLANVVLSIRAGKAMDKQGKLFKVRDMYITDDYIFYEKTKDYWFPLRVVKLKNIIADYETVKQENTTKAQFKLHLVSQTDFITILLIDKDTFNKVMAHIAPKIPFMNFENKYKLEHMIEQKKLWSVFQCRSIETGQPFRLKACNKDYLITKLHSTCQIKNEINISFKIKRYAPQIIRCFESKDSVYILYEMKLWTPISTLIPYPSTFSDSVLRYIFWSILRNIYYIESDPHVIHKDISADTVVIDKLILQYSVPKNKYSGPPLPLLESIDLRSYELLLTDFNMSVKHNNVSHPLSTYINIGVSDPEYLDPSRPVSLADNKSDLYSAGLLIYHIVAGRPLMAGDDLDDIFDLNQTGGPTIDQAAARFAVKPTFWDLLLKMLASSSIQRISVKEALLHVYFTSYTEYSILSNGLIKSMNDRMQILREQAIERQSNRRIRILGKDEMSDHDRELEAFMAEIEVSRKPVDPSLEDGMI